jgi:hypothetical protein
MSCMPSFGEKYTQQTDIYSAASRFPVVHMAYFSCTPLFKNLFFLLRTLVLARGIYMRQRAKDARGPSLPPGGGVKNKEGE